MGAVFGKISEETPHFESLGRIGPNKDIEIRRYDPIYTASVSSTDVPDATTTREFTRVAFVSLARYIGVFTAPENKPRSGESGPGEAMAMTAPVIMASIENNKAGGGEPIAMTAPVLLSHSNVDETMSFILPSKFAKEGQEPPIPLDSKVHITKVASRVLAVKTFTGELTKEVAATVAAEIIGVLELQGKYKIKRNDQGLPAWEYMGYNSPFTLPWCRTNESAVLLEAVPTE
ncbi:hypothetical protein DYB32_001939 [Aphanomyces invadans]|uniref:SOUL heme-binding protein n=1 Tax=Aphanomyces invadans TaxID=157072 RepID=A0A3R6WR62_9STRA|nr:hypothetical protein DYB32_001939 [Aphanomyces invadans]